MTGSIKARQRNRVVRAVTAPTHKFDVGLRVLYPNGPGSGLYRVTGRLPDGGQGLQYRIRGDRDGQERVVIESALRRATALL
jgi:hypothetical protein